eukprot:11590744-Alexandrium_andersonii.AAC.1
MPPQTWHTQRLSLQGIAAKQNGPHGHKHARHLTGLEELASLLRDGPELHITPQYCAPQSIMLAFSRTVDAFAHIVQPSRDMLAIPCFRLQHWTVGES